MPPRQLCNSLLHKLRLRPRSSERTHVKKVATRETFHSGKLGPQVEGQAINDAAPPPGRLLLLEYGEPDRPIQLHQRRVDLPVCAQPGRSNPIFQFKHHTPAAGGKHRSIRGHKLSLGRRSELLRKVKNATRQSNPVSYPMGGEFRW